MRLLNGHTVLISPADSKLIKELELFGINTIKTKAVEHLLEFEKYHADMQLFIINDTAFISKDTLYLADLLPDKYKIKVVKEISKDYPYNILLNAALIKDTLICKHQFIAEEIKEYAKYNNINIVNTNQGYAKCSSLILSTGAVITSDPSIHKAVLNSGNKCLLISPGHIELPGADYGFIGGASGVIGDMVIFFGDISKHPDCDRITEYIRKEGMKYISTDKENLRDIGGFIQLH